MTPRERAIAALELKTPDDIVPTFEILFDLTEELLGRDYVDLKGLSGSALDRGVKENAGLHLETAETLDWSMVMANHPLVVRELVRLGARDKFLLCAKGGDRTYRFGTEKSPEDVIKHLYDDKEEFKLTLSGNTESTIRKSEELTDAGIECFVMGADYAGTNGPFLSTEMFEEFVTPYLYRTIEAHRRNGAYVIKHTDGYILPIIEQILACQPHALHSLDPIAGIDIAEMKKLVGDRVCLAGNVDCAALAAHDGKKIRKSARYCLEHGMPGGGYIYSSSNSIYRPMTISDYRTMLAVREEHGRYDG